MGPVRSNVDVPSRPSSANSFTSNKSCPGSYNKQGGNSRNSSYAGGYGSQSNSGNGNNSGGGGGRSWNDSGAGRDQPKRFGGDSYNQNQDFNNVSREVMERNAGSLGLNPSSLPPFKKVFYNEHPELTAMSLSKVEEFRRDAQMTITGRDAPKPILSFHQANFPESIEKKLVSSGFSAPTPIQAQGWSMALSGKNMVGIAQTGSGKTLSFVLPALVHIRGQSPLARGDGPIVLILAPTRELAVQIQEVTRTFGNAIKINSTCVYGGAPKSQQIRNIRSGCEVVVATPGRLLDLVNGGIFNLERCSFLVLDEADRMLDMGFEPQIRQILNLIRTDRQVLMWSATWPKNVMTLAHDMLGRDFIQVKIGAAELHANKKIKQVAVVCDPFDKKERLAKIMEDVWNSIPESTDSGKEKQMVRTIIFCNKKSTVDTISRALEYQSWPVVAIHGDKVQYERDQAIRLLKNGQASILVATDVAARGLDVKDVMIVVNFDLPGDIESYVHRIGRTARGTTAEGTAYSLVTNEDSKQINDLIKIMEDAGQTIPPELASMRRLSRGGGGGGGRRYGGSSSYGYGRGHNNRGGDNSGGRPKSHIRFNPY